MSNPAVIRVALLVAVIGSTGARAQPADCRPAETAGSIPAYIDIAGKPGVPPGTTGQIAIQIPIPAPGALACSDNGPPPADVLRGYPARDLLNGPGLTKAPVRREPPPGSEQQIPH